MSASGWINQARKSPQIQVIFLRQGLRLVFSSCARDSCFSRMNNHRLHLPLLMFLNVFSYVHAHKPYALRLILNRFAKMELFLTPKIFLNFKKMHRNTWVFIVKHLYSMQQKHVFCLLTKMQVIICLFSQHFAVTSDPQKPIKAV